MHPSRTRWALGLVSGGVILLELALLRLLALRFWDHIAQMVIAVAMLGFGVSGPALLAGRRLGLRCSASSLAGLALAFALSVPPAVWWLARAPLDVPSLAWLPAGLWGILALEVVLTVPFLCAGMAAGLALTDEPELAGGHYAAALAGSGLGAPLGVFLMSVLPPARLPLAAAGTGILAAFWLMPGASRRAMPGLAGVLVLAVLGMATAPADIPLSPYKALPQLEAMPGTRRCFQSHGPMGRLDAVTGPAVHHTPGLGLQYAGAIPDQALLLLDGEPCGAVCSARSADDFEFMDHTTLAAPYHLRDSPRVLIVGLGGGTDAGLALYHRSPQVTVVEMNRAVIEALTRGPLARHARAVVTAPGVALVCAEARSFLATREVRFDVIQVPLTDALGAAGAGLYAGRESSLYTVEAFALMLDRLAPDGILAVTRWAQTPPREGLRVFDTAARALRAHGLAPAAHLAMLRNWATVTVLAFRKPVAAAEADGLRRFCSERGFDLCYLPGLRPSETNRYHRLARPYYYEGALALLGPGREAFLGQYPFSVAAAVDDRPYFHHFFRLRSLPGLMRQAGARGRAFVEMGYLLAAAALVQITAVAAVLLLAPLALGARPRRDAPDRVLGTVYFIAIGAGFMLLEMGMFQRFVQYLGHPVFSAAAVIASFLVFGGLGSLWSARVRTGAGVAAARAAAAAAVLALAAAALLPGWLARCQGLPMTLRAAVTALTIAPLALAMGQCLPLGLRNVSAEAPGERAWLWGANGFASVTATAAAPLLAMAWGLRSLGWLAAACYAAAALAASRWQKAAATHCPGDSRGRGAPAPASVPSDHGSAAPRGE